MAAFANVSVNDGQTTPVAHSFTVGESKARADGSLFFQWLDFSVNGGVPIGANRIEMTCRMPSFSRRGGKAGDSSQVLSIETKTVVSTLETLGNNTVSGINPQPTHAFDTTVWSKLVRNGRAVVQNVKDALAFDKNFRALAVYTDAAYNYAPPGQ